MFYRLNIVPRRRLLPRAPVPRGSCGSPSAARLACAVRWPMYGAYGFPHPYSPQLARLVVRLWSSRCMLLVLTGTTSYDLGYLSRRQPPPIPRGYIGGPSGMSLVVSLRTPTTDWMNSRYQKLPGAGVSGIWVLPRAQADFPASVRSPCETLVSGKDGRDTI